MVKTKVVGMGRVLVMHSHMCYRSWKVILVPLGQDCFYGVRGTYPVGRFGCRHRFAPLASRAVGSSSPPVLRVTPPKHGAVLPAAWQTFRESGKKEIGAKGFRQGLIWAICYGCLQSSKQDASKSGFEI